MNILIENIIEKLKQPLPGLSAHLELAPYRNEIELDFKNKNPKIASTLLLLYPKDGETFFCLIEHLMQVSFNKNKYPIIYFY